MDIRRKVVLVGGGLVLTGLALAGCGSSHSDFQLRGKTEAETAQNVVRLYHDTHVYIEDVYMCSNMAVDLWDMLEAQGINSLIVIYADHCWILAEVEPGKYLACDATTGLTYKASAVPDYYKGWGFSNPTEVETPFTDPTTFPGVN